MQMTCLLYGTIILPNTKTYRILPNICISFQPFLFYVLFYVCNLYACLYFVYDSIINIYILVYKPSRT